MSLLHFIIAIIFGVSLTLQENAEYEVYEANNTYPHPVLLENNDVLALSGQKGGKMKKYNSKGEVIIPSQPLFEYQKNSEIKQLIGNDKRYVIVSGINTKINITLFDDSGNYYVTQTDFFSY